MTELLTSLLAFLVTIGLLVAFHEYGHYWVARRMGVKVLTYSIGFGRTLWSTRRGPDNTEYRIAALPLGGYVRMLDEREGPVPPDERHRTFNCQPVGRRALIVLAGPVANILIAIFAWWLMFMVGVSGLGNYFGPVAPGSAAERAGLMDGDRIVAVDGRNTGSLDAVRLALLDATMNAERQALLEIEREGSRRKLVLDLAGIEPLRQDMSRQPQDLIDMLGLRPWTPALPATIRDVQPDSAGERAGLQAGDVVLRVNGESYRDPSELIRRVSASPAEPLQLEIERDGRLLTLAATPRAVVENGEQVGRLGVMLGFEASEADRDKVWVIERLGPVEAVGASIARSWDMTVLTFRVMARLLTGEASLSNIAGPVTIADYAGKTALIGLATFLSFFALVSLSLAILNLLPVPMLDGGHLLMYAVEAIRGRPVSEVTEAAAQRIGFALLIGLMTLAFYNDFVRLFG